MSSARDTDKSLAPPAPVDAQPPKEAPAATPTAETKTPATPTEKKDQMGTPADSPATVATPAESKPEIAATDKSLWDQMLQDIQKNYEKTLRELEELEKRSDKTEDLAKHQKLLEQLKDLVEQKTKIEEYTKEFCDPGKIADRVDITLTVNGKTMGLAVSKQLADDLQGSDSAKREAAMQKVIDHLNKSAEKGKEVAAGLPPDSPARKKMEASMALTSEIAKDLKDGKKADFTRQEPPTRKLSPDAAPRGEAKSAPTAEKTASPSPASGLETLAGAAKGKPLNRDDFASDEEYQQALAERESMAKLKNVSSALTSLSKSDSGNPSPVARMFRKWAAIAKARGAARAAEQPAPEAEKPDRAAEAEQAKQALTRSSGALAKGATVTPPTALGH